MQIKSLWNHKWENGIIVTKIQCIHFFLSFPSTHLFHKVRYTHIIYIWPFPLFQGGSCRSPCKIQKNTPLILQVAYIDINVTFSHLSSWVVVIIKWDLVSKMLIEATCNRQAQCHSGSFCTRGEEAVSTSSYLEERRAQWCEDRGIREQMHIIRANYLHWKISKLFPI